jgi:hypothetical protein
MGNVFSFTVPECRIEFCRGFHPIPPQRINNGINSKDEDTAPYTQKVLASNNLMKKSL